MKYKKIKSVSHLDVLLAAFLGLSRQIPGRYYDYVTSACFRILSNSSVISNLVTRCYTVWILILLAHKERSDDA
jgi:hypothetical protein